MSYLAPIDTLITLSADNDVPFCQKYSVPDAFRP